MGFWFSKMLSYFGDKEARILVLGLDNAGKTTILCTCGLPPSLPHGRPDDDTRARSAAPARARALCRRRRATARALLLVRSRGA